jgi:hypothetical protein
VGCCCLLLGLVVCRCCSWPSAKTVAVARQGLFIPQELQPQVAYAAALFVLLLELTTFASTQEFTVKSVISSWSSAVHNPHSAVLMLHCLYL